MPEYSTVDADGEVVRALAQLDPVRESLVEEEFDDDAILFKNFVWPKRYDDKKGRRWRPRFSNDLFDEYYDEHWDEYDEYFA